MSCEIRYSKAAVRDLDRIWSEVFLASKSPDTAEEYLSGLMDSIENKADFPQSGSPLYYDNLFTGYYFVVFKAYIAFYRLIENDLIVDRILYGRSDYMKLLSFSTD